MTESISSARAGRLDYPPVEARTETVSFGDVSYQDPFRWLEEDDDPQVTAWQEAQDIFTQAHLVDLPGFSAFADKIAAIGETGDLNVPRFAGGRWFKRYVPDDQNLAVVEMSDTPAGPGRRIVDMNAMQTGEPLQLSGFVPSPDGRKAVFAWAAGGREEPDVRVIDVDTGAILVEGLPHRQPNNFNWLPDSSGFFYFAIDASLAGEPSILRLDLDAPTQVKPQAVSFDHPIAYPIVSADRRHVLLMVDHLAPRPEFILDLEGAGEWRPFMKGVPGIFRGDILGDRFIAITDDNAPRGRLLSIPLATPTDRDSWEEIVPASDNMLASVVVTGGRAVLMDLVDTYPRLRVFGKDGSAEGEIALPVRGAVNSFASYYGLFTMLAPLTTARDGEITFVLSSFGQSPALCSVDVATRQVTQLTEPKRKLDVQVRDLTAQSADGARIVYHVVARGDVDLSARLPTVITGYGGFNVAIMPGWLGSIWTAWIEAGGVVVLAHLRGGGEYGTPGWEQGRMKHKQNSFNDVHAIAEDLIARGIATPERLGVIGGSNGGTMAAAVAVQRPDLYRATVPQVPITDILGRVRDPVTMVSSLDYGDPADPDMAKVIYAWSPYQNVRDDIAYPAMLIDCGGNDPRCPPWHGRKFAARMQQASSSDQPILLRVRAEAGHGSVGKAQQARQAAEVLAFLADRLRLAV